jgi:prevent-host-death family protein
MPTVERVGAHQFRNHFGYYMEKAAGGTEVQVSKRGRPFARLVGAQGKTEEVTPACQEAPVGSPADAG